jgi:homoserine kinase type II
MNSTDIRKALEVFGASEGEPIVPVRESPDNAVFFVGVTNKKVLRVSKRLPIKDIAFEREALDHLSQRGVPVPRFLRTKSGAYYALVDGATAILLEFIEGHQVQVDKDHLPTTRQAFEAGRGLAGIHNAGKDFAPSSPRRRTLFSELERALSLEAVFTNQFEGGKNFIDQVKSAINFGRIDPGNLGLIHNDYRPSNILFDDANTLVGIIDFDWSCIGPIAKDFALGVLEWSFPDGAMGPDFDVFDSFFEGYNSIADQKQEKDQKLYDWIAFAAISDAATYFCDLAEDPNANKRTISSYMYRKYRFFSSKKP